MRREGEGLLWTKRYNPLKFTNLYEIMILNFEFKSGQTPSSERKMMFSEIRSFAFLINLWKKKREEVRERLLGESH